MSQKLPDNPKNGDTIEKEVCNRCECGLFEEENGIYDRYCSHCQQHYKKGEKLPIRTFEYKDNFHWVRIDGRDN